MPGKRKILTTGSGGMLGTDLVSEFKDDYNVYGLDLVHRPPVAAGDFSRCDITNEGETLRVISKIKPDIVIHTAAWTDVDGCELDKDKAYEINSEGTENVALGCKSAGAVLVYISTDFVFNGKKRSPYKETDRPDPLSIYGDSKLLGENAVDRILDRYFILRTSWLYGSSGKNFVDTIIEKARASKELKVVDDQVGSPTYTKDLAEAIGALLSQMEFKGKGIYHVSNSGSVSWYDYAKTILKLSGSKTKVIPISSKELDRPAKRPAMSVLDNSKFSRFTGYKMRNWKAALEEYLAKRGRG